MSCSCTACGLTTDTTKTISTATVLNGISRLPEGTPRVLYSSKESYVNGDHPLFSTKSNAGSWRNQIKDYLVVKHRGKSTPGHKAITDAAKKESDGVLNVRSERTGPADTTYYLKVIDLPETLAVIECCPRCIMSQNGKQKLNMKVTDPNETYRTISKNALYLSQDRKND